MKFVYLYGKNQMIVPICPDRIVYIDYAADAKKNLVVNRAVVILDNGHGVEVVGNPRDVGKEIENQTNEFKV